MFQNTRVVGVVIGSSIAVASVSPVAWAKPNATPAPSLRSLDLKVSVPESSVSLGGPASSETVFTRPTIKAVPGTVPGIVPGQELDGLDPATLSGWPTDRSRVIRWVSGFEMPSLFEGLDGRPSEVLLEASHLESPAMGSVSPWRGTVVLGLR